MIRINLVKNHWLLPHNNNNNNNNTHVIMIRWIKVVKHELFKNMLKNRAP